MLAAGPLLVGCFDFLAGNGSEVENAVVAGTIVDAEGEGVPGVKVSLVRDGYDPLARLPAPAVRTTNAHGAYGFHADTGTYNVQASDPGSGRVLLIQKVRILGKGRWDLAADSLRYPGRLRLSLPKGTWKDAYAYVPGTTLAARVDEAADAAGEVVLDSLPPGRYEVLLARPDEDERLSVGEDVPVESEAVSALPFTHWERSLRLKVDLAEVKGGLSADVAAVPLLLRLQPSDFDFAAAAKDGKDLRITNDAGTTLPYHIQSWSPAEGALVWIRVDKVRAKEATRLRLYWGNDTAAAPNSSSAFSAADGFVGAWHLDDKPAGNPSAFDDASTEGNSATALGALATADTNAGPDTGVAVSRGDGVTGRGVHLNGKDALMSAAKTYRGPSEYAFSLWIKTATREGGKILGFIMPELTGTIPGRTGNYNMDRTVWMDNDGFVHFGFTIAPADTGSSSIGNWQAFVSGRKYNDGQWHHIAGSVSNGRKAVLSIDGERVVDYTGPIRGVTISGHWQMGYVGDAMWDPVWTSNHFRGSLDEVRILHASRSEDWLKLDYASQKPGSRLLTVENP
jgi:hypothetical protein